MHSSHNNFNTIIKKKRFIRLKKKNLENEKRIKNDKRHNNKIEKTSYSFFKRSENYENN